MSEEQATPWWYSGGEDAQEAEAPESEGPETDTPETDAQESEGLGSGFDVMSLLSNAVRMVDWAAGAVVEPHAEHGEPGEHPDCLICRTLALVTDRTGLVQPRPDSPVPAEPPVTAEPIRWVAIED